MITVEKMLKSGWGIHKVSKSMQDAKKVAQEISKTHTGEVKAEKRDRNDYMIESFYYENGKETESYTM